VKRNLNHPFLQLMRVAVGTQESLERVPSEERWEKFMLQAHKQTLLGLCFSAIERLPKEQQPSFKLKMNWHANCRALEERNRVMNEKTVEVWRFFKEHGFEACILKGQGNAAMYPNPLRRNSGDVDVWVVPKGADPKEWEKNRKKTIEFIRSLSPDSHFTRIHIDCDLWKDVTVEVHFYPGYQRNPFSNKRLKEFYVDEAERQFQNRGMIGGEEVCVPTVKFNLVFQMCHIFNHFFTNGVGMRQMIDYLFLLKQGVSDDEKTAVMKVLKDIGLDGFAAGVMWVLHYVLGLPKEYLLTAPNEKRGIMLIDEIVEGGNFGKYEKRYWNAGSGKWQRFIGRIARKMHFVRYYPGDVFWDMLTVRYKIEDLFN